MIALFLNSYYITYDRPEVYCHLTKKKQRSEFFFFFQILIEIFILIFVFHSLFLSQTAQIQLSVFLLVINHFGNDFK